MRVRLANSERWPHFRVVAIVESVGLNNATWANATNSARVADPMAAWAQCVGGKMSSSHSFDVAVWCLVTMMA